MLETLRADVWPIEELYWSSDLPESVQQTMREAQSRWHCVGGIEDRTRLTQLCGSDQHQGILARMGVFPCGDHEALLARVKTALAQLPSSSPRSTDPRGSHWPLWVICDRIQDGFNLGAILRVCDGVRAEGVIIGHESQVPISPQVARSSAGAVNHVPIFQVADIAAVLDEMSRLGVMIAAGSEKSKQTIWQQPLRQSIAVIIGNEGEGISPTLQQRCQLHLGIPMTGQVSSLNAAVAAGVLLYEIRRQQWTHLTSTSPQL